MKHSQNKLVSTIYGHKLLVDTNDEIGKEIIKKGIYDKSNLYLLNKILTKLDHPVVFDIGANIGNHSISISDNCKIIYAFEPDTDIFNTLESNIKTNNINNIHSRKIGLSNKQCTSDFYINIDGNLGASTLHPTEDNDKYIKSQIQLTTGDQFISDNSINKLDLLKIDIEGHELQALEGLEKSINKFQPIISMEWTASRTMTSSTDNDFFNKLISGYTSYTGISSLNKSLWKQKTFGMLRRYTYKLTAQEYWILSPADLSKKHANIFLIPNNKLELLDKLA